MDAEDRRLVAVTGATGGVGSRVVHLLTGREVPLRAIVRPGHDLPDDPPHEIREASGYAAAGEMREALSGVHTLFLIPARESAERVAEHRSAIGAALDAGVARIVYLSSIGAAPDATFTLARDHFATEQAVRGTGLGWTFLRMNLYTDFLPSMVTPAGEIRGPAGEGRLASVTRDDVAAAAAVLASGTHTGETFELTGPEGLTLAEAAAVIGRAADRPIIFVDESDEQAYASRTSYAAPRWELEGWVSSYQAIRDGSFSRVSGDLERLTGRAPTGLAGYIEAHPEVLDGVPGG